MDGDQMVLVMLAIPAADLGDSAYFSDFLGGSDGQRDPFLKPPFNVHSETARNNSNYLLATCGGFIQALLYGLSGLRLEEQGLVPEFAPTLPRELSNLKLVNIAFRSQLLEVTISRLPSGQVVRRITARGSIH